MLVILGRSISSGHLASRRPPRRTLVSSFGGCPLDLTHPLPFRPPLTAQSPRRVQGLLSLMCDCVVELDQDLLMKEHYNKLAGMLMLGPRKSTKGGDLTHFLACEAQRHGWPSGRRMWRRRRFRFQPQTTEEHVIARNAHMFDMPSGDRALSHVWNC